MTRARGNAAAFLCLKVNSILCRLHARKGGYFERGSMKAWDAMAWRDAPRGPSGRVAPVSRYEVPWMCLVSLVLLISIQFTSVQF